MDEAMLGIGFGSGGSHTTYMLYREKEGLIAPHDNECAESIADARGEEVILEAVDWIVNAICSQPDKRVSVCIGAAGFSASAPGLVTNAFQGKLSRLKEDRTIRIFIANDAVALLKSPPLRGRGIVAIVGTGSVVMGVHPSCGVVRRGGYEWLVSDEGSGVWMTLQCIRLLIKDIQKRGSEHYHSPLLDRLCDYFDVKTRDTADVAKGQRALAKADLIARKVSESSSDTKRRLSSFVYPSIFDLATGNDSRQSDRIAAQVLLQSVSIIAQDIAEVAEELTGYTANSSDETSYLDVVVTGSIGTNPSYLDPLQHAVNKIPHISSLTAVRDGSSEFAKLAYEYGVASEEEQEKMMKSFDAIHSVARIL